MSEAMAARSGWWRRNRPPAARRRAPPVIAGYTGDSFWTRHRNKLIALLGLIAFVYGFVFAIAGTFVLMQLLAPLVVVVVLSVWLLPDTGSAPVGLLDRLLLIFLVGVICWPNYLAIALPGMPWITVIRLLVVPLAIVMMICLSTSAAFRTDMKDVLAAAPPIWKLYVAFTVLAFLSIFVSRYTSLSINKFIVAQLYWTLIFFAACYTFSKPGQANALVAVLLGSLVVVALIGVWEWRIKALPWAGHVPSFLKVDDEVTARMMSGGGRKATGMYRVKSVFWTPLQLAEYLALCTPFMIHFAVSAKTMAWRLAGAAGLLLTFFVIVNTDSRLGVIGFLASFLVYVLAWGALRWRDNRGSVAGPIIVLSYPAIFCAFIAASFFVRRLRVMMWGGGAQQASSDARRGQIAKGVPQIISQPWGHGIGTGGETLHYANQSGTFSIDSYYLSIGLEYGILGFIIYYGLFIAAAAIGARHAMIARSDETRLLVPLVISLLVFLVIKSVLSQESNHPVVFAMLGAIVALVYRVRQESPAAPRGTGFGARLAGMWRRTRTAA